MLWATPESTHADLLEARAAWFLKHGEVFDEDRQIEMRMSAFLEHYVCDRVAPHFGKTPARERYEKALREENPARAAQFRAFTETVHGMFVVRRIIDGEVRVRGLFNHLTWDVSERRVMVGLSIGDVLEARLLPIDGRYHFTPGHCFHPREALKLIVAEVKRRERAGPVDQVAFIQDCAQRALKVDRYRQIAIERIYDFGARRAESSQVERV